MPMLLKCPSRLHTVRLDSNRFWQTAICPKCKVPIDPTRVRRAIKRLWLLFPKPPKGVITQPERIRKGEEPVSNHVREKTDVLPESSSKKTPTKGDRMSVDEMRTKLLMLKDRHPSQLLLIRSEHDVDKIDIMNSELHGPFDFGDARIIETVETALSAGKQVAVQGAGRDKVLVHTANLGKKLFR